MLHSFPAFGPRSTENLRNTHPTPLFLGFSRRLPPQKGPQSRPLPSASPHPRLPPIERACLLQQLQRVPPRAAALAGGDPGVVGHHRGGEGATKRLLRGRGGRSFRRKTPGKANKRRKPLLGGPSFLRSWTPQQNGGVPLSFTLKHDTTMFLLVA